jgi:DNA-binding MarR family transcriptional regulator
MAKKKDTLIDEAEKIKADLATLKKKKKVLDSSSAKKTDTKKSEKPAAKKSEKPAAKKSEKPAAKKSEKPAAKKSEKPAAKKSEKPAAKKVVKKTELKKPTEKPIKIKKLTKAELEEAKREAEKTLEEELEEQLTDEEIENFQIEKVDMERLTNKVCDVLAERESEGMFQSELWKKLKLSSRDGSRLSLKLERMGTITREKLLENNRWTYKLILKKTPISTQSIENAPCLVCPVEQKCSLEGEISPTNCQFIEDWVLTEMKKPAKSK